MSNVEPQVQLARRRTLTAAVLGGLLVGATGCATSPSSRIAAQVRAPQQVWIVVWPGAFRDAGGIGSTPGLAVAGALRVGLPDALRRNGMPVSGYLQLARPLDGLPALSALWSDHQPSLPETSHALVLTAQRLRSGPGTRVEFEAALWDTTSRALAWKAAPSFPLGATKPARAAELMAGDLLRALQRDALVTLAKGYPIDASGAEIDRLWEPLL